MESPLNSVRILIVDDDQLNRSLLRAIFEAEGCHVILADGGAAGLEALAAQPLDIVLLDLRMPGLDGIETLRRMRDFTAKVPILMLTSQRDVTAAVEATRLGADDFITRPIENEELVMRMAVTLRHRRTADELETLRTAAGQADFIRALIDGGELDAQLEGVILPMPLGTLRSTVIKRLERMAIAQAMRQASGNKAAAARLLQVDVKTLYTKLRRYDLEGDPNAPIKRRPMA